MDIDRLTEFKKLLVHPSKLQASSKVRRQTCQCISQVLVSERNSMLRSFPRKLLETWSSVEFLLISAQVQANFDQTVDVAIFGYSYWH